ncbi:helix-turn-helix domain-containing protein [Amycolatopsis albispora]|uniref:HTH cro/C1-type domain-containing protein n=1 Tax=Amycolatopsis albispora TaxID=1804986 RepID=A0A344LA47_9PSEU|nr:helix-turn-helix transcriptional regulator [Amycolatopsis albispora]AXB44921.1 hypothetical protein A4R43_22490 [Amycolatopsis albispora]
MRHTLDVQVPDLGPVIRAARVAAGLTLRSAGARIGYSASTLSRVETGHQQPDLAMLWRLVELYGLSPSRVGLSTVTGTDNGSADGDGMRRRLLLAGVLGSAATALLHPEPTGKPVSVAGLRARIHTAQGDYLACRYAQVTTALPGLLQDAQVLVHEAKADTKSAAWTLLAYAYRHTAWLALRLGDEGLASGMAHQLLTAARAADDPLVAADAAQLGAVLLRRSGEPGGAAELVTGVADRLHAGLAEQADRAHAEHAAAFGGLLAAAAYTAATDSDRARAVTLYAEATSATQGIQVPAGSLTQTAAEARFLPLYGVSIARALGDYGTAIERARAIRPETITIPERRARYWQEVAQAWHGWGKPEAAFRAVRQVERCAPQELNRPWARQLTRELLGAPRANPLPGLREFAARVGVT